MTKTILISGNSQDSNIAGMIHVCQQVGAEVITCYTDADKARRIHWDILTDELLLDGEMIYPDACFIRYDYDAGYKARIKDDQYRARTWFHTLFDWACAHEDVRFFNRCYSSRHTDKAFVHYHARRLGLPINETCFSNDLGRWAEEDQKAWIVKHLNGGHHTILLEEFMAVADTVKVPSFWPLIIQRTLSSPELRMYRIGDEVVTLQVTSESLDYREHQDLTAELIETPKELAEPLVTLMDYLGLEFGAADFKYDPQSERFVFLEVNSAPMFVGFSHSANTTKVLEAMVKWLLY